MFDTSQYELLDFGAGRKLERFGKFMLDRPSPAAIRAQRNDPERWQQADAAFDARDEGHGRWDILTDVPETWEARHAQVVFHLKLGAQGAIGLFPEQAENWDWIEVHVRAVDRPARVLNLFAYTGGSTLAAAAAGAEVTHVDAARTAIAWARQNAQSSGLENAKIRWIEEDALKFARREVKRGSSYDAVILDPPSYGRGPRGENWKLDGQLDEILSVCHELTARERGFLLVSCHSGELAFADPLRKRVLGSLPEIGESGVVSAHDMRLRTARGDRELQSGAVVRWSAQAAARSSEQRASNSNLASR